MEGKIRYKYPKVQVFIRLTFVLRKRTFVETKFRTMKTVLSVVSWNVEHFKKPAASATVKEKKAFNARRTRVIEFLSRFEPDVIALYEVEGKEVFTDLTAILPGYNFHITEGPQTQEILIGVRHGISAFFTQKLEFKSGGSYLRPGALLTITLDERYTLLFLHTKSGNDPRGFGLRDDMLKRAIQFRKVLNKSEQAAEGANYLFMGDLNTMGMYYPYDSSINVDVELKRNDNFASRYYGMKRLKKSHLYTYCNGSTSSIPKSDLDHVYASKHLKFRTFADSEVQVAGWVDTASDAELDKWIRDYSDHSLIYLEIVK